jgi:hypothetical protein
MIDRICVVANDIGGSDVGNIAIGPSLPNHVSISDPQAHSFLPKVLILTVTPISETDVAMPQYLSIPTSSLFH